MDLQQVFDLIQRQASASAALRKQRIQRVLLLAQEYHAAADGAMAMALAKQLGVTGVSGRSLEAIATEMLDAVGALPEFMPEGAPAEPPVVIEPKKEEPKKEEPKKEEPKKEEPKKTVEEIKAAQPDAVAAAVPYPYIVRASAVRPLLILGGVPVPEKLKKLEEGGVRVEWPRTNASGPAAADSAIAKIKNGTVCGVLTFVGFFGNAQAKAVKNACILARVPSVQAREVGTGQMHEALVALNQLLSV